MKPRALYGAPAGKTNINKIQVIQNSALRVALTRNRRTHMEKYIRKVSYSHKS